MTQLLFLCTANAARSQMAEGFAKARSPKGVVITSAGTRVASEIHPLAIRVMAEVGIDISKQHPKTFGDLQTSNLDVVVTLCDTAAKECALMLPGHPSQVNWALPDPAAVQGSPEDELAAFRETRDAIKRLIDQLFDRGYLKALAWASEKVSLILDSLPVGIIAHDMQRNIIFFNKAAEAITGYSKFEAVGRDCHDVFRGNFCGTKCACGENCRCFNTATYPIDFVTKEGEDRQIEMSVRAIKDDDDSMFGVLASFRDLTVEHNMARRLGEIESFSGIIGRDKKMLELFDLIRSVADSNVPVLIHGESGTGKELVAAAIHNESRRANKLFVPVNCGALPEGLLESELFGHVRGAFTGAIRDKKGRFELAHEGTIFLDEIGDISPAMQVKLLRVLQEGTFERVGGTTTIHCNGRVISATNRDLNKEIAAGRFREDLYYRLCVVPINLPPLRERYSDIPLLVDHIIKRVATETDRQGLALSPTALDAVLSYHWPGNVRELQNALQFAVVKSRTTLIEVNHLPPHIISNLRDFAVATTVAAGPRGLGVRKAKLTAESVEAALQQTDGNPAKAARLLGVGRATLHHFLVNHLPSHFINSAVAATVTAASRARVGRRAKLTAESVEAALQQTGGNRAKAARLLGVGRATLYRFFKQHC